ncbi:hypothetical protein BJF78_19255 [Pseudonocardia sp. CNS-139]|nr:hypothetical protein BJF78_19255 [Pseudonocardia sp. CNS-139]
MLATDGLWRDLPKPGDLARRLTGLHGNARLAVAALAEAAGNRGGRDDLTVAAITAGSASGPVATGTWTAADTAFLESVLARLAPYLGAAPVAVLDVEALRPRLAALLTAEEAARLDATLSRLVAFGWAGGAAVVLPAPVARLVDLLVAADPAFAGWWDRLLRHELEFHVGGAGAAGERHDADAAVLVAELRRAVTELLAVHPVGLPAASSTAPHVLTQPERDRWANTLEAVLAEVPDGYARPALVLDIWVLTAGNILRGDWDPHWPRPPPVVVVEGPRAGYAWVDGTLHVVATRPEDVVQVLVAALFAGLVGFDAASAPVVAALAGRALPGPDPLLAADADALLAGRSEWRALAAEWAGRAPVADPGTRPNLRPENYPVEVERAASPGAGRVRLDGPGAVALAVTGARVKGVVALDGVVWLVPEVVTGPAGGVELSHAVAARGDDVRYAFTARLGLDADGRVVVEQVTPHSGHYNAGNTDARTPDPGRGCPGVRRRAPGSRPVPAAGRSRSAAWMRRRGPRSRPGCRPRCPAPVPSRGRSSRTWRAARRPPSRGSWSPTTTSGPAVWSRSACTPGRSWCPRRWRGWWSCWSRPTRRSPAGGSACSGTSWTSTSTRRARGRAARRRRRRARRRAAAGGRGAPGRAPGGRRGRPHGGPADPDRRVGPRPARRDRGPGAGGGAAAGAGRPGHGRAAGARRRGGLAAAPRGRARARLPGHPRRPRRGARRAVPHRRTAVRRARREHGGPRDQLQHRPGHGRRLRADHRAAQPVPAAAARRRGRAGRRAGRLPARGRRGARLLDASDVRNADVAAARRDGRDHLVRLLADIGVWAALRGVDAVYRWSGPFDRHYLVVNRGAMLIETGPPTTEPWSGDGMTGCTCGETHWGRYGGAGLLVAHRAADGTVSLLLQRRSETNQHGGTWGLFGGARALRETAVRAAMRETSEEADLDRWAYTVRDSFIDDHGGWTYTTVLAEAADMVPVAALSVETSGVAWVRVPDLGALPLHPGFAASWPAVAAALLGLDVTAAEGPSDPPAQHPDDGPPAAGPAGGALSRFLRRVIDRRGPPPGAAGFVPLPLLGPDGWVLDVVHLGLAAAVTHLGVRWAVRARGVRARARG